MTQRLRLSFQFLPEMDSSLSIMDILEVGVIKEDAKDTKPETEEEQTWVPST